MNPQISYLNAACYCWLMGAGILLLLLSMPSVSSARPLTAKITNLKEQVRLYGRIGSNGGTVTVNGTVSGNSSVSWGGGICDINGTVTINGTVSGNTAIGTEGGGIWTDSTVPITFGAGNLIQGNTATNGGGIRNVSGVPIGGAARNYGTGNFPNNCVGSGCP